MLQQRREPLTCSFLIAVRSQDAHAVMSRDIGMARTCRSQVRAIALWGVGRVVGGGLVVAVWVDDQGRGGSCPVATSMMVTCGSWTSRMTSVRA